VGKRPRWERTPRKIYSKTLPVKSRNQKLLSEGACLLSRDRLYYSLADLRSLLYKACRLDPSTLRRPLAGSGLRRVGRVRVPPSWPGLSSAELAGFEFRRVGRVRVPPNWPGLSSAELAGSGLVDCFTAFAVTLRRVRSGRAPSSPIRPSPVQTAVHIFSTASKRLLSRSVCLLALPDRTLFLRVEISVSFSRSSFSNFSSLIRRVARRFSSSTSKLCCTPFVSKLRSSFYKRIRLSELR